MHPTVVSDKPGACPVCGMDLVRVMRAGDTTSTDDVGSLVKSPSEAITASIKTIKGEYLKKPVTITGQGIVTYDTRNIYTIPTRVGGRLEKVYLKYPYQPVTKGQKVAEIYSPELLTAQRELLFLVDNDPDNQILILAAKRRLSLLGVTESQINELIKRKNVLNSFTIYSPYNGYLIGSNQQAPSPALPTTAQVSNMLRMDGKSNTATSNAAKSNTSEEPIVQEGNYVSSGQPVFKIVNPATLRVAISVSAAQATSIQKGSLVELDFGDGQLKNTTVDFVQPFFNQGQDFATAIVYARDTRNLHIGHLVNMSIKGDSVEGLWIPKQAVLDLGLDKIVFIKDKKVLKPKKVVADIQVGNAVLINEGLSSSDEIAANAQYLVDSESFIKTQQ